MPERAEDGALNLKALATLVRVRQGFESRQAPVVSQIVRLIKEISGRADKVSVADLAEFISHEPTTMGRVLALAATLGYNPTGAEISSVHHAILIIGFDRVRTLAISLLLLKDAELNSEADTSHELAGLALVGGLLASEMASRSIGVDADLAFICGALRSYGRMIAATFLPDGYLAVTKLRGHRTRDEAFKAIFGLTDLELGREVLAEMQLPQLFLNSFENLTGPARKHATDTSATALIATADFGLRLAELIQAPDVTNENFYFRVETLSREYDALFYLSKEPAVELLEAVLNTLNASAQQGGISMRRVPLFRRLECLVLDRPLSVVSKSSARPAPAPPPAPVAPPPAEEPRWFDI